MTPLLRFLLALLVAVPVLSAASSGEASRIEPEIRRLEEARIEALLKGDVKGLERLFADDMVYIHSAGRIDTKQGYLASLAAGNLTYVSLRYDPAPKITVAGPDTALASGRATIEFKTKGGDLNKRVLTTITVYVRSGSTWRVASYQGTPVQP